MAVRCTGCGFTLSIEAAAAKVTEGGIAPIGSAGGGYMDWWSGFLADGYNRRGMECPECKEAVTWEPAEEEYE